MLAGATGCSPATYQCTEDAQCAGGACLEDACAFADETCASGMRFAKHSRPDIAGVCVPLGEGTTSSGSTAGGSGSATAPPDPTLVGSTTLGSADASAGETSSGTDGSAGSGTGPPPDPDLLAWYPCEGKGVDIAVDMSGNQAHGECLNCPTPAPGPSGQACTFDGEELFSVPFESAFMLEEVTLSAWVRIDSIPTGRLYAVAGVATGELENNAYQIGVNALNGVERAFACYGGPQEGSCIDTASPVGSWFHLAMTAGIEGAALYLNGENVAEGDPLMLSYDMRDFLVGRDVDNLEPAHGMVGSVDEIQVRSRALTADEIVALADP